MILYIVRTESFLGHPPKAGYHYNMQKNCKTGSQYNMYIEKLYAVNVKNQERWVRRLDINTLQGFSSIDEQLFKGLSDRCFGLSVLLVQLWKQRFRVSRFCNHLLHCVIPLLNCNPENVPDVVEANFFSKLNSFSLNCHGVYRLRMPWCILLSWTNSNLNMPNGTHLSIGLDKF